MFAAKIMRWRGFQGGGGFQGEGVLGGGSRGEGGPGISENVHDRLPYKFSTIEIINKWT